MSECKEFFVGDKFLTRGGQQIRFGCSVQHVMYPCAKRCINFYYVQQCMWVICRLCLTIFEKLSFLFVGHVCGGNGFF